MHIQPFALRLLGALSLLRFKRVWVTLIGIIVAIIGVVALWLFVSPPDRFPVGEMVRVEEGQPLSVVADRLAEQGVIRSSFVFSAGLRVLGKDNDIDSCIYIFEKPENVFGVAYRIIKGEFGFVEKRITVTEGMTVREIGEVLVSVFPDFDVETFLAEGEPLEGYLFPDTYFFMPDTTPQDVIARMRTHFDEKIVEVNVELEASDLTLEEAIVLASILEKEGRSFEVRQQIAGVLMNRLEREMPLQVDAVFGYIYGVPTYSPTLDDLESDSPYNTYRFEGLPPGPINNPGIEAVRAALTPIPSEYLYYLTDNDGVMRYARTFEEHKANRERYGI